MDEMREENEDELSKQAEVLSAKNKMLKELAAKLKDEVTALEVKLQQTVN